MKAPRLRAPQEHGQILAVPSFDQVDTILAENHRNLAAAKITPAAPPLADLRDLARRDILAAASTYLDDAGQSVSKETQDLWLVAGHQPELFHPGVWFKNFALRHLAQKHGATSLNLVIDTDTAKTPVLHVPAGGKLTRVAFDRSQSETPYEERRVEEEATFASLPERMKSITAPWGFEPMLETFWRDVMAHSKRTQLLGERFAAARRNVERRWGCVQLEVPMSRVCQTEAFAWFGCAILERLAEFHATYNQVVRDYRLEHGIQSRSHPVPDLAADGDWLEAPFWAWRSGQARRGKLFVRSVHDAWHLRVGGEKWPAIPSRKLTEAVAGWRELERQGLRIRSRALTTTMFARLFLADLFMHGIGGGIYDELTDRIMRQYFRVPAPAYLMVSATLLLPLERFPGAQERMRELGRQWRDLVYKPELFLGPNERTHDLVGAKRAWIAKAGETHAERAERYHRIREINARLLPFVQNKKIGVETEFAQARSDAEWHAVAARRDYAFCLYPEAMLRTFFQNV